MVPSTNPTRGLSLKEGRKRNFNDVFFLKYDKLEKVKMSWSESIFGVNFSQ